MKSLNSSIRYISAGEVSSFVVCPESWRLERIKGTSTWEDNNSRARQGIEMHNSWAARVLEARFLLIGIRVLLYLLALAIITLIFVLQS